jgi:PAS domain S-box-containing protein
MKSDELQQLGLASLGGCSWEYDLKTDRITYSDEFFALLGYGPGELTIDTDWVSSNIHPKDLSQWRDAFVNAVKGTSKYFDCELRFKHKDDSFIWIQTRGVVVEWDKSGYALSIVGVVFDISQRKTAKENESRYRLFLDNIPDAISLKDQAGRYLYINRQFESWLGKPSYQIYGQTADQIFESDHSELFVLREHEREVWESGGTIAMERGFPRTEDGKSRHAMITKYPIFDETGDMLGIGTTNTDISAQYRAQEAIRLNEQRFDVCLNRHRRPWLKPTGAEARSLSPACANRGSRI